MKNVINLLFIILFLNSIQKGMEPLPCIQTLAESAEFNQTHLANHATYPSGYYLGIPEIPAHILPGNYDPKKLPPYCNIIWRYIFHAAPEQQASPTPPDSPSPTNIITTLNPSAPLTSIAPSLLSLKSPAPPQSKQPKKKRKAIPEVHMLDLANPKPTSLTFVQVSTQECQELMKEKDRLTKAKQDWLKRSKKHPKD